MKNTPRRTSCSTLAILAGLSVTILTPATNADTVKRVSQRDTPLLQGNSNSLVPHISSNGNYAAFYSTANNLPAIGPALNDAMILVKNLTSGAISWQSQRGDSESPPLSNPRPIHGLTSNIVVSNSGVAFWENTSDNTTSGLDFCPDNNGVTDIYYNSGYAPTFSSSNGGLCGGLPSNGGSREPAISSDSTLVAFESDATNFTGITDTNSKRDIYVRNVATGAYTRASLTSSGNQANGDSFRPSLSTNGAFVAYSSNATNIVSGDTNGAMDVFMANRSGVFTAERISVATGGGQANAASDNSCISGDGRYIVFTSAASNLVAGDTNAVQDIFVRDRTLATTKRISVATGGAQANGPSFDPVISGNGRYIAYSSDASNLVSADTNAVRDVFMYDQTTSITTRISVSTASAQSDAGSGFPSISFDGLRTVFSSDATNLIAGDTNTNNDVFMYTITPPPANDSCGAAVVIGLGDVAGTTSGAFASGSSLCGATNTSPDVYYTFTPVRSAYVRFETITGDYDTVLSLHSSCPATAANQITCDDDSGVGSLSIIAGQFVTAGVPVTVRVTGFNGASGDFTLRLTETAPPNDLCAGAMLLSLNSPITGTNVAAGNEGFATCAPTTGADVYYKFTPTCTAMYTIDTAGPLDTVLTVHTGCPTSSGNTIACNDDGGPGLASSTTLTLTAGVTYYIRTAGFNSVQGSFVIGVHNDSTLNDECVAATPLLAGGHPFNNCAATPVNSQAIVCNGATGGHDLWYTYTSTDSAAPVTITTGASGFDTILVVYTACPNNGGISLGCNDDIPASSSFGSLVRVTVDAGTTITIRVAGFANNSGEGTLTITQCVADVASADGPFPDGIVDGNDFIAFINSFGIGDAGLSPVADVNGDGIIDGNDFVAFINAFAAGC